MGEKSRVAVVFGGRSTEHSISCITAGSVLAAIDRDRYDVVPLGITRKGGWVSVPDDPDRFAVTSGRLPEVDGTEESDLVPAVLASVDVVFPLLHGPYGEDGTIQGLLEMAGVRYVGAGVLSSAVAMDKYFMKLVLAAHGLPGVPSVLVRTGEWDADPAAVRESVASLGYPVFVKPARGGSSIGISKVDDPGDLDEAVATARACDPKVLVEAAISGAEIECGVIEGENGGPPEASVPARIRVRPDHPFYDFDAKYIDGSTEFEVPADLPPDVASRVQRLAVEAYRAVDCESLARVDFFVTDGGAVVVNEVNTMPGFTPSSMFPRMWAASGMAYPELVDRLLRTALRRPLGLR